jgi:hypothetical protein
MPFLVIPGGITNLGLPGLTDLGPEGLTGVLPERLGLTFGKGTGEAVCIGAVTGFCPDAWNCCIAANIFGSLVVIADPDPGIAVATL